jgi:hypothetical protein|nr:MAG TPA: hypothetical protein [Caudoviricetes sp.]
MLKFKKGGYTRHDSGTVYKVKDIFPNKYNPQVLLVSLVTRKRTYTRVIQTDKMAELVAQRLSVDENGEFIMRELTTEEFEEIEKALYKEGNRKVIATTLEGD